MGNTLYSSVSSPLRVLICAMERVAICESPYVTHVSEQVLPMCLVYTGEREKGGGAIHAFHPISPRRMWTENYCSFRI